MVSGRPTAPLSQNGVATTTGGKSVVNGGEIARQWIDRQGELEGDVESLDNP